MFGDFMNYDWPEIKISDRAAMSKKRVAYFYDEDVGNFHYGEFLFGQMSFLMNTIQSMSMYMYSCTLINLMTLRTRFCCGRKSS